MRSAEVFLCKGGAAWSPMSKSFPWCLFLLLVLCLCYCSLPAHGAVLRSVPDIEKSMYQSVDGTACVRLLNLKGEVGCADPGRSKVQAPLQHISDEMLQLGFKTTIVLPSSALHEFLNRTLYDPSLAARVAGVLVEYDQNTSRPNTVFSPDVAFPQSEFSPYKDEYTWNTAGFGLLQKRFNFPMLLLSEESSPIIREYAAANKNCNFKFPLHVAEFDFVMQTTKAGTHDSDSCLKEWACLPLGGYSVWSSLPFLNATAPVDKPLVLAVASMDSASLFRDSTPGADSSLSGLIALLAAADALSKVADVGEFQKQIVFLVLTGESWGYLGSRRFLLELAAGNPALAGLSASHIHQILEVGSVGQAVDSGGVTLYAHRQKTPITTASEEILEALEASASSLSAAQDLGPVEVRLASELNPGIPPSSLMSFVQKNASIAGVVLEEFDKSFKNPFYHSHLDDAMNINTTSIIVTASIIARTIYLLGDSAGNSTLLQSIHVNSSLVNELVGCLLARTPGLECDLVKSLITPIQAYANHYVGVLLGAPSFSPYLENIDDTSRFVWNFLASRTGTVKKGPGTSGGTAEKAAASTSSFEECVQKCSDTNEVCVGATGDHKGHCMMSTTRYIPAYSPRLQYQEDGWRVTAADRGDIMSEVDPVWTESFWKSIHVQAYLKESSTQDDIMLGIGSALTVASFCIVFTTRAVFQKRLKRA